MKKPHLLFFVVCILILAVNKKAFCQNVGIGINPTKARLEVSGAVGTTTAIFGSDGAGISLQRNYPAIGFNQYYSGVPRLMQPGNAFVQYLDMPTGSLVIDHYSPGTHPDGLAQGQTRRLTIAQNGNVSINNIEKDASLFVGPVNFALTVARFRGTQHHSVIAEGNASISQRHTTINAGKTGSHVFINDQGLGNVLIGRGTTRVGINSADPSAVLEIKQVAGLGLILVSPPNSFANWEFRVVHPDSESGSDLWMFYNEQYKGNFHYIDGLYYKASDRRVKSNIKPLPSLLDKVMSLRPVTYQMKHHNPQQRQSIGFVAQEVRAAFPEITSVLKGNDHGYEGIPDLHTMNYEDLGPIAIKAIQEQQQKIKSLKERNDALLQRIEAVEKALAAEK